MAFTLAYVPDFPFLYDKLTPLEFLRFTGQLYQVPTARAEVAIGELVERFNVFPAAKLVATPAPGSPERIIAAA